MTQAEIKVEEISSWFRSKEKTVAEYGITLAELKERKAYVHAVRVDFGTSTKIARISGWISGEFDFEILQRDSSEIVYFRHESVSKISDFALEQAFGEFIERLQQP